MMEIVRGVDYDNRAKSTHVLVMADVHDTKCHGIQ
jgi:hypothetical protein